MRAPSHEAYQSKSGPARAEGDFALSADDLDKEQIEQLHAATLQVSGNCFELKKLCATVLIAAATLLVTLSQKELDHALFVGGLIVVVVFWTADAQSYYVQAKLRARMKDLQKARAQRLTQLKNYSAEGVGLPIEDQPNLRLRVLHSFFNASMLYYFLITLVLSLAWTAYDLRWIR